MNLNIVFMGSPEFAVPALQKLATFSNVVGVVTQPDRPAGRGRILTSPPVKNLAQELGIPVIQPVRLKDEGVFEILQAWKPDLIIVAAFGQILRQNVLDLPRFGCINVHASLLPRWRGAAPIQAAILHGDTQTGVTIMKMDTGIDTGSMLAQRIEPIHSQDTPLTLSPRLANMGAELLIDTLPGYVAGEIIPQEQDEKQSTYAPMLKKEDGKLDFNQPAIELEQKVRAFYPWPGCFMKIDDETIKVIKSHVVEKNVEPAGTRLVINGLPAIATGKDVLAMDVLQPAGKKVIAGDAFLRGYRNWTTQKSLKR